MKVSRNWLQVYFEKPLSDAYALSDALTFHAFEIDGVEVVEAASAQVSGEPRDDILDVKITANRGHDCLSHRGIAKELSAILDMPMIKDPLRISPRFDLVENSANIGIDVTIEDPALCNRYLVAYVKGVKVGPSPTWLKTSLEAIGQRSINNIVDATNYVMFNIGQPLHAFDAAKLQAFGRGRTSAGTAAEVGPQYMITVRRAREGEKIVALDEKEYELNNSMLVIADGNANVPIGIAGVKGGMPAGITVATTDIILESANFNGVSVRKTAQALKLRTDASARFEQVISPELAAYGMRDVIQLILEVAGGQLVVVNDQYPVAATEKSVSISTSKINAVLGSSFKNTDVEDVFRRLSFAHTQESAATALNTGDMYTVHVPFERLDLNIPEDLIEEVGRIMGYEKIPSVQLPPISEKPAINPNFYAAEKVREALLMQGYSEVFTSVFAESGERVVLNKVDGVRPYLRTNLITGLTEALKKNIPQKYLLGLREIKLFEIGTVWKEGIEVLMVGTVSEKEMASEKPLDTLTVHADHYEEYSLSSAVRYQTFSRYPSIVRDIALWTPAGTNPEDILSLIKAKAGELLAHAETFDEFVKGDRVSYAFRLVFQSFDRTLTDVEVNAVMDSIAEALREKKFELR
ncbi:MAG TPA: phenylalanine--tRNA ligase subunit beta [Candidatus Paceibacterota bacterium]|nr:phenylalanine--tRNA ligase subunit beta [Candidatus Paceibacterota bacterium]